MSLDNWILILLFLCTLSKGWAQEFAWVKNIGGSGPDGGTSMHLDSIGNIISIGRFSGVADFDPGTGVYNLVSTGVYSAYIQKLDSSGSFIWAGKFSGAGSVDALHIVIDGAGDIYCVGHFTSTVDFDPGPGLFQLTSAGQRDIFIAKLDSNGGFLWAKRVGGSNVDYGMGIAIDSSGDVIISGSFQNTIDADPGLANLFFTASFGFDTYISKLDTNGNLIWARQFAGAGSNLNFIRDMAVDYLGNIYTCGYFTGTADFDPGPGTATLTSLGDYDAFIQKFAPDGSLEWVKKFGSAGHERIHSIAVDQAANVFFTGFFENTVDFDPGQGMSNLSSIGGRDIFLGKFNTAGDFVWVRHFGGAFQDDRGNGIEVDADGNILSAGFFGNSVDFNPLVGNHILTSSGSTDGYISILDNDGNYKWAGAITGAGSLENGVVLSDLSGNIYSLGNFVGISDFDPAPATHNLASFGSSDAFLLKLSSCKNFERINIEACSPYISPEGDSITTSGIYTYVLQNSSGCDSTLIVDLEILNSYSEMEVEACGSYLAPDGILYTQSGNYTATFGNVLGCDSTIRIKLNVVQDTFDIAVSIHDGAMHAPSEAFAYQWLSCEEGDYKVVAGATLPEFLPSVPGNYAVAASYGACRDTSLCIPYFEKERADFYIPNIITPDGNGSNDCFEVVGADRMSLRIFNRWGKQVYESKDYQNDWDGNGLPSATYYYELTVRNLTYKGWISVFY